MRERPAPLARLAAALAAALLLLPGAGLAQKGPAAEPAPSGLVAPSCGVAQRHQVETALAEARERLAAAIALIAARPDHPHVRRWFGNAPREHVRLGFERTAAVLAQASAVKILCNPGRDCGQGEFAFARTDRRILGLCPAFFSAGPTGVDTRWGILIHEASHIAGHTDDHAYGQSGALRLAKEDPRRAARNADNYEYFAETLPR